MAEMATTKYKIPVWWHFVKKLSTANLKFLLVLQWLPHLTSLPQNGGVTV